MITNKQITPYQHLMNDAIQYMNEVNCGTKPMFQLDKSGTYAVADIHERIMAAKQLGYHVILEATGGKIIISYKKDAKIPYSIRHGEITWRSNQSSGRNGSLR